MSESAELEPWQQRALETITKYKGRGIVQITGRNAGKNQLSNQAFKRLWEDLHARPVEALICDHGTVYGSKYYTVEPYGGYWPDMEIWCHETFGETGSIWQETKSLTPGPHKRWYANNRKFWFKDVKDRDWFILKWNS